MMASTQPNGFPAPPTSQVTHGASFRSPVFAVVIGRHRRLIFRQTAILGRANILECGVEAIVGRISPGSNRRRLTAAGASSPFPAGGRAVVIRLRIRV